MCLIYFHLHYFVGLCCLFITGNKIKFSSVRRMRSIKFPQMRNIWNQWVKKSADLEFCKAMLSSRLTEIGICFRHRITLVTTAQSILLFCFILIFANIMYGNYGCCVHTKRAKFTYPFLSVSVLKSVYVLRT